MEQKDNKTKKSGGLYARVNMSLKTADIIISVLILAFAATLIAAVVWH